MIYDQRVTSGAVKKGRDGIVYSTNPNFKPEETEGGDEQEAAGTQDLRIFLDRLGGGKMVSRISGFDLSEKELELLAKELKKKCGGGGGAKEGMILIQGDHREKILKILLEKGYKAKKAGG